MLLYSILLSFIINSYFLFLKNIVIFSISVKDNKIEKKKHYKKKENIEERKKNK